MQPILLVELRRPLQDFAERERVLQLIRTSAHLLVQLLFPRTYLQLYKFLLVSTSHCLLPSCACSVPSCKKPIFSVSHDQLVYSTQRASTALANASQIFTTSNTSKPITPNFCMLLPDIFFFAEPSTHWTQTRHMVNGAIMSYTKWQHACRTKFTHTSKCDDHCVRPQQILETSARAIGRQHFDPRENKERHIRKKSA